MQSREVIELYVERMRQQRFDIANVLLDIIDYEKRFVADGERDAEGLRMQIREVAAALINNKPVTPDQLHD